MAETFGSIKVVTQDGNHELDIKDVPRAQKFQNFKSRVAMELARSERKYINPADLDLFVFSEKMEEEDRTLADYGLKDGAIVTRVDLFNNTKPQVQAVTAEIEAQANLPPYPGKPLDNVFVKLDHRTINLHGLTSMSTIQDLYDKLKQETKISQANTGLIYRTKELKPNHTLNEFDIGNNSTVFVFDKLPGGAY